MYTGKSINQLVADAQTLHASQREAIIQSTNLVAQLDRHRASAVLGMNYEQFANHIGLTKSQYTKRVQAARIMRYIPETKAMLEAGETEVSCLALLAARLTKANQHVVLPLIKNKSREEVAKIIARVTADGQILEEHQVVTIKVTLTEEEMKLLERAREVLAAAGHVPTQSEIFVKALRDLLWGRDPLLKAERSMARAEAKRTKEAEANTKDAEKAPGEQATAASPGDCPSNAPAHCGMEAGPETEGTSLSFSSEAPGQRADSADQPAPPTVDQNVKPRSRIPAHVRHEINLRDRGQCTWRFPDGSRCPEKAMLEPDHLIMKCRGGSDEASNLTLRCRFHNIVSAEINLGRSWRDPEERGKPWE